MVSAEVSETWRTVLSFHVLMDTHMSTDVYICLDDDQTDSVRHVQSNSLSMAS